MVICSFQHLFQEINKLYVRNNRKREKERQRENTFLLRLHLISPTISYVFIVHKPLLVIIANKINDLYCIVTSEKNCEHYCAYKRKSSGNKFAY